NTTSYYS
ncbi:hypothetical protein EC990672_5847B, partial [Escherichia coli 99.0672]